MPDLPLTVELLPSSRVMIRTTPQGGEQATSLLLDHDDAVLILDQLASLLGYHATLIKSQT